MKTMGIAFAYSCVVFSVACGPGRRGGGGGGDGGNAGSHIELSPADATVMVVDGAPVIQAYTATLIALDGSHTDVTASASFSLQDPAFGAWSGAQLSVTGGGAGPTQVVAMDNGATGSTGLTVYVTGSFDDGAGVPTNAASLFSGATETPARAPTIAYPSDGILVPPNLGAFDVHWRDTQNTLFDVEMKSQYVDLHIYKVGSGSAYTAYAPDEWYTLASGHLDLALTVAGLDATNPAQKGTSTAQTVHVTNETVAGGVYYWSTSSPLAIYRYDMSTPATPPSSFFPPGQSPTACLGCHGLSHDGTKMALTLDGANGRGTILNVADRSVLVPYASNAQQWNFATFTPDAAELVTVFTGNLSLRTTAGGAVISTIPSDSGYQSTDPEISPDGTQLANVETQAEFWDGQTSTGSIVTRTFDQTTNTFGPIRSLVPNASGAANYYPSYSPDGQWLLFTRTSGNSYNAASAEIWVVKSDGSAPPIQLQLADGTTTTMTNSWARWAPFQSTFGPNSEPLYFITLSSKRPFGVRALPTDIYGTGSQIWMAPFFPSKAMQQQDPTGPAFRMPFQDLTTSNHIAQWTEAIVVQ